MSKKRIVIVGGVAGGASAAARARRLSEEAEIIMFERGPYVSFANCGLPYYVGGEIAKAGELLLQTPESLRARFNLDVRVRSEVTGIDRKAGIAFQALHLHPGSHAGYYPGATPIALKLLFAPGTGKLLGAQAAGRDGIDKRLDVLATALKAGLTVHDLAELELAYAPPFGSAKDPVNLAGMAAENVLNGDVALAQWDEIAGLDPKMSLVLDVRSNAERQAGSIPGSIHIPLQELRQRLGELPQDREIIASCQSGQRSYYASRTLSQHGFRVRNLSGSYRTWKTATS
jgi:rhodanese-related sulfurtransferase